MKDWAVDKWRDPLYPLVPALTGVTAEKHDSFIGNFDSWGKVLMDPPGKELIEGETDGFFLPVRRCLRATSEARGWLYPPGTAIPRHS